MFFLDARSGKTCPALAVYHNLSLPRGKVEKWVFVMTSKKWDDLKRERASAHYLRCREDANAVVKELSLMGIRCTLFGSLVNRPDRFRTNSDIDLCIFDLGNKSKRDVLNVITRLSSPSLFDLSYVEDLSDSVRSVVVSGVSSHVE